MKDWQPIKSVPKDGTPVVVGEYFDGGNWPEEARWRFWTDHWRSYRDGLGAGLGQPANPSVWMSLPDPPSSEPSK